LCPAACICLSDKKLRPDQIPDLAGLPLPELLFFEETPGGVVILQVSFNVEPEDIRIEPEHADIFIDIEPRIYPFSKILNAPHILFCRFNAADLTILPPDNWPVRFPLRGRWARRVGGGFIADGIVQVANPYF
jgi:hypothetical protein